MKIAVLSGTPEANYLEDGVIAGCISLLGAQNVDYAPYKHHLSGGRPAQYPERTCWYPGLPSAKSYHSIVNSLDTYDLTVIGYPSSIETAGLLQEAAAIASRAICIVGEDAPVFRIIESLHPTGLKFIRERAHLPNDPLIRDCPLPYNAIDLPAKTPWLKKDIDLLWVGAPHHGRAEYIDVIREFKQATIITNSIAHADYLKLLNRTKLCVVLHGAGRQTYRHLEAAAAGCCVLEQGPTSWDPLYPSGSETPFETPEQLRQTLVAWTTKLSKDDVAQVSGDNLREALIRDHTHVARAAQILAQL